MLEKVPTDYDIPLDEDIEPPCKHCFCEIINQYPLKVRCCKCGEVEEGIKFFAGLEELRAKALEGRKRLKEGLGIPLGQLLQELRFG